MRDRLRKLIYNSDILCDSCGESTSSYCAEAIAEHLLANGVIVPPCKVGDTLYEVTYDRSRMVTFKVESLSHIVRLMEDECFGELVFTTKAEAEAALAEREGKG